MTGLVLSSTKPLYRKCLKSKLAAYRRVSRKVTIKANQLYVEDIPFYNTQQEINATLKKLEAKKK